MELDRRGVKGVKVGSFIEKMEERREKKWSVACFPSSQHKHNSKASSVQAFDLFLTRCIMRIKDLVSYCTISAPKTSKTIE